MIRQIRRILSMHHINAALLKTSTTKRTITSYRSNDTAADNDELTLPDRIFNGGMNTSPYQQVYQIVSIQISIYIDLVYNKVTMYYNYTPRCIRIIFLLHQRCTLLI
jgi:hypothetical protein